MLLTKLIIRNFKLFQDVEIELGERVVLVGPNNTGKTTVLQALTLWDIGVRRWIEKRGVGEIPKKRAGVTINRRDLVSIPIPAAKLLWRDLHVREGKKENGKVRTSNILIEIIVEGIAEGKTWRCGLEFDYANEESLYCRPLRLENDERMGVPPVVEQFHLAFLPPMSGLAAREDRLDPGSINVRIGEGRTAEVMRNLCYQIVTSKNEPERWDQLCQRMKNLFGVEILKPQYIEPRGEIIMSYRDWNGIELDISASGRGMQQTLLLLAHMTANHGSVLLLDEPGAHLEILRQRQIYELLTKTAAETQSQIIAASHSEVILNEAADRDIVIAFIGKPHRIDDRGSQVLKALKEIGFEHYLQAEQKGWVLYLEGSTDLAILRAFAEKLNHPANSLLERPFVHYIGNQPRKAQEHFYGLREAKPDLVGIALYDRLEQTLPTDPNLHQLMWNRREIENYLCQRDTLLAWAETKGREQIGELSAATWRQAMEDAISEISEALASLGKPDPWSPDLKASDDFLDPLFRKFYEKVSLPNLMPKTDYHTLAPFVPETQIDAEVSEKLDFLVEVTAQAKPVDGGN